MPRDGSVDAPNPQGASGTTAPTDSDGEDVARETTLPPVVHGVVVPRTERPRFGERVGSLAVDAAGPLRVEVRAYFEEDDEAVPNARVTLFRQPDPFVPAELVAQGTADADGRLVLPHPGGGRIGIRIEAESCVPLTADDVDVPGDRSLLIEGWTLRGLPLTGRLLREEDGAPGTGTVRIIELQDDWRLRPIAEVEVASRAGIGRDGTFRFSGWFRDSPPLLEFLGTGRMQGFGAFDVTPRERDLGATPAPPGASVAGIVQGPNGAPAARATVLLVDVSRWDAALVERRGWEVNVLEGLFRYDSVRVAHIVRAWTGADGRYVAEGLRAGATYAAIALSPDHGCSLVANGIVPEADGATRVPPLRMRAPSSLVLEVVGEDGAPVESASIRSVLEYRSDVNDLGEGRYRFAIVDPVTFTVEVEADDGRSAIVEEAVEPGAEIVRRVVLAEGARLAGRALDASGEPVPDASVYVSRNDGDHRSLVHTNAAGHFEIRGLPVGSYDVSVSAKGFEEVELKDVAVPSPELQIVLGGGANVTAVLRAPPDGELPRMVSSYTLWRSESNPDGLWSVFHASRVGPNGHVTIADLPTGALTVAIAPPGYRAVTVEHAFEPGETLDLGEVDLRPPLRLEGTIVDEGGTPVEGVDVRLATLCLTEFRDPPATSADGRFVAETLQPGAVFVRLGKDGFAAVGPSVELREDVTTQTFVLPRGVRVSGIALDEHGAPLADTNIVVRPYLREDASFVERIGGLARATTDAEGRFEMQLVEGRHEYPTAGWFDPWTPVDVREGDELVLRAPTPQPR